MTTTPAGWIGASTRAELNSTQIAQAGRIGTSTQATQRVSTRQILPGRIGTSTRARPLRWAMEVDRSLATAANNLLHLM
jgi:hypothetical protein